MTRIQVGVGLLFVLGTITQASGAHDPASLSSSLVFEPQDGAKETDERLRPYVEVLQQHGVEPVRYVAGALAKHDLVIFDDALHTAVEPFDFYRQLIKDESFQKHAPAIFLELIPSNKQWHLDAYLNADSDDRRLLYPAFQDNANGLGFNYKTYFDFLQAVRAVNQTLPAERRLKVFGVGGPTYWAEIQTPADLAQYYKSTMGYDHHMYHTILGELDQFRANKKGILLTNTRHAYKGIKRKDGQYFWNTGTFFAQWHPGKAHSIRLHNMTLSIQALKSPNPKKGKTLEGMERIDFKFVRMAQGLWDSAYRAHGDRPVAIPLAGNAFGQEAYIGNHQLDAMPSQKIQDAYDALIFLAPIEKLRQTALVDFIYTPAFKEELKRRYRLQQTEAQLAQLYKQNGVDNLDALIAKTLVASPERPQTQAKTAGPIDEWKGRTELK
ncbi:MAG: hypothetical protein HY040_28565 [Planctomycetes bacterium]|nr:hypothetical protein [Planctomycetota bacterium]